MVSDSKSRRERKKRERHHPKLCAELLSMHGERPGTQNSRGDQPKSRVALPLRSDEEPNDPRRTDSSKHPPGAASRVPSSRARKRRDRATRP